MAERFPTIEDMVAIPQLHSVCVSDDGRHLAYVQTTADWDENTFRNHVWIYEAGSGNRYALTTGDDESSNPSWSPDSRHLAYTSPTGDGDDKKDQIYVRGADGGQGVRVSHALEGVGGYTWLPDGRGFIFAATPPETEEMKKRKEIYGDFEYVDTEYRRTCLYFLELKKGLEKTNEPYTAPKDMREADSNADKDGSDGDKEKRDESAVQLTDGKELHVLGFDVSPDGGKVVFTATPSPNLEDRDQARLYLLDVATREVKDLGIDRLGWAAPLFSPDGARVCYSRSTGEAIWLNNQTLEVLNLATGETARPASHIDENTLPSRWTDKGILIWWQEKTNAQLGLIDDGGQVTPLLGEPSPTYPGSVSRDGTHLAYLRASATDPFDIYLNGLRVTTQHEVYERFLVSRKAMVRWHSHDGTEIEGVLSTPSDFDPAKPGKTYPLLVVVHGGPTGTSLAVPTDNRLYPIEPFVAKGFIVLEPNYRGSAGYGEAFRKLNYRDLGTGDYADVISGVDHLIDEGLVDREQVGIMGWSQGGYISAFCAAYSDRFKAISVGAGISNWVTYYVNTDIHQFTRIYLGQTPWEDSDVYAKTSPMTYITRACTPTLIQHGDKDNRVPLPNAFELYQGLRDMGVATELVVFKGMQHGPEKPGLCRAIMTQNLHWFSHHILGESMDGFHFEGRKGRKSES
jgi:dipeptidyl aminopeptidase/acylaminoacyl peptidase